MIRLWVNDAECTVPQDLEIEFSYNTNDADGLETQCSHYTTQFSLPRTPENMAIFTPLFDIRTLFGSASFDIHSNADAIMEVAGQSIKGYVKMESIDETYHLRFIDGAGLLLDALSELKLADVTDEVSIRLPYAFDENQWKVSYGDLYGGGTSNEYYVLFPAFTSDEDTFDSYDAGVRGDTSLTGRFKDTYWTTENGNLSQEVRFLGFTEHQARIYRKSHLRCAAQVKHLFDLAITAAGFTADYTTDFFKKKNPYWANLFMVLRQSFDVPYPRRYDPSAYMPDITCKDFILGYCKLFGLRIELDGTTVHFYTRKEWYDIYSTVVIGDGVDRRKGITVSPNSYADTTYGAFLECNGTDCGKNAEVAKVTNIYDGLPFSYCDLMEYAGPVAYDWHNTDTATEKSWYCEGVKDQTFSLPYIEGTEGGELLFRDFALDTSQPTFWLQLDSINDPSDFLTVGPTLVPFSVRMHYMPLMSPIDDTFPLYAYKTSQKYNYNYQKEFATAQDGFSVIFKDYFDEICSKDNVMLDMECYLTPEKVSKIATCKPIVNLDGVLCRVIECVTNRKEHCKLKLQKIDNPANLILGQGFGGYYLRLAGYLWVPGDASIGDKFRLPIETNDTVTYIGGGNFTLDAVDPTMVSLATTPDTHTSTWAGFADVAFVYWDVCTVRVNSGLTVTMPYCFYRIDRAISYGHTPEYEFVGTGQTRLRPMRLINTVDPSAVLRLRNPLTGTLWTNTANYAMSVDNQGRLTIEALDASTSHSTSISVTIESEDGTTVYARSELISITTEPA